MSKFFTQGIEKSCQGAFLSCLLKWVKLITMVHLLSTCGVPGHGVVSCSPLRKLSKERTMEVTIPTDPFCR